MMVRIACTIREKKLPILPVDALAEDAPTYHKEKAEPARIQAFRQQPDFEPVIDDATAVFLQLLHATHDCFKKNRFLKPMILK